MVINFNCVPTDEQTDFFFFYLFFNTQLRQPDAFQPVSRGGEMGQSAGNGLNRPRPIPNDVPPSSWGIFPRNTRDFYREIDAIEYTVSGPRGLLCTSTNERTRTRTVTQSARFIRRWLAM